MSAQRLSWFDAEAACYLRNLSQVGKSRLYIRLSKQAQLGAAQVGAEAEAVAVAVVKTSSDVFGSSVTGLGVCLPGVVVVVVVAMAAVVVSATALQPWDGNIVPWLGAISEVCMTDHVPWLSEMTPTLAMACIDRTWGRYRARRRPGSQPAFPWCHGRLDRTAFMIHEG